MEQSAIRSAGRAANRRRLPAIGTGLILLACAGLILYPEVLSLSFHPLETKSDSLDVSGVYWTLPLANVDSLSLISDKLTVTGKFLPFPGIFGEHRISRTIPRTLAVMKLRPDYGWTVWTVSDLVVNRAGKNIFWHSIMNLQTGKRFSFAVTSKDFYPDFRFYHGRGDTSVAIFAFAKSSQSEKNMMGYFLITGRTPD